MLVLVFAARAPGGASDVLTDQDTLEQEVDAYVPAPRAEDGGLAHEFVESVQAAVEGADQAGLLALTEPLHEADLGDLIEALPVDERPGLVRLLGDNFDFAALTELDEAIRSAILEEMPAEEVAEGIGELESDDAVFILEDLDQADQDAILEQIPLTDRVQLQRALDYPEESAGRLMQTDFIAIPPFWTVGQTIDYMRVEKELPDSFYEIFVVDPAFRLLGSVPLDKLLRSKRGKKITKILKEIAEPIQATEDQEDVARQFERYNLVSAAVVDESDRLVGVLTVDDILDVLEEEAEEDFRALAGVGDEEISDSVVDTVRGRFSWLVVNLGTAVVASLVIGLFDATIEHMVALAVLMPIVASMGGNAGTQTMTVAVRALATRDIGRYNAARVILREMSVGVLNGLLFAVLIGFVAGVWFSSLALGGIIGMAMIINMVAAGLAGILIPITLDKLNIDPAIASGVFVTTVTDVVGFFAFLGLAAWWFGLGF